MVHASLHLKVAAGRGREFVHATKVRKVERVVVMVLQRVGVEVFVLWVQFAFQ